MLEALILYSLFCFAVFYLLNHSDLVKAPREWVYQRLPGWLAYSLSCAFCLTFWVSLGLAIWSGLPAGIVLTAPPLVLLINLAYVRLSRF